MKDVILFSQSYVFTFNAVEPYKSYTCTFPHEPYFFRLSLIRPKQANKKANTASHVKKKSQNSVRCQKSFWAEFPKNP